MNEELTYTVVQFYKSGCSHEVKTGLTLAEAKELCNGPDSHGEDWFYGFREE